MISKNETLPLKLPPKPKAGLYIDDSNLYHCGKEAGWMVDYKKLYKWVAGLNTVVIVYIASGDSDFLRNKRQDPKKSKAYKVYCFRA